MNIYKTLVICAMVLMYFRLRSVDGWRGFAIFQLVSAPVLLAGVLIMIPFTGGLTWDWSSDLW